MRLSTGDGPGWLTFGEREDLHVVSHLARFGVADCEPVTLATILALGDRFTAWHERLSAGRVDLRPPGARAS